MTWIVLSPTKMQDSEQKEKQNQTSGTTLETEKITSRERESSLELERSALPDSRAVIWS